MTKPITLDHTRYEKIKEDLVATYGQKILISFVCRRELGFTFREHQQYNPESESNQWRDRYSSWYVDFYSDQAETMFRLKYL